MASAIKKEKLRDIKHKILRPSLTSHYLCNFTIPDSKFFNARGFDPANATKRYDRLSLACSEASLPGSSLATLDINNDFHGVSEKHAYRRLYDDRADFTFYVDSEEYYVIKLFETWLSYCVDEQYGGDAGGIQSLNYTYRVNFPKKYYAPSMSISKFERDFGLKPGANTYLEYNFIGAFPISISSMPVSYDASNLLKATVSFSYQRYYVKDLVVNTPFSSPNPNAPANPALKATTNRRGSSTPLTPSIEDSIMNDPRAYQFGTRAIDNSKAYVRTSTFNERA